MAVTSKIEWTDSTFNPIIGCQHVSPGCDHCYAEAMSKFRGWTEWGPHGERRRTSAAKWREPRQWNANAKTFQREHGRRQRVFCASLADWLDNRWPDGVRDDLRRLIDETPELDWLLLTKRPENALKLVPTEWFGRPNVWLGVTAEDALHYRRRWAVLSKLPAVVRFISYEPAVGSLGDPDIGVGVVPDWIISGGESGPQARVSHPEWYRECRDHCSRLDIAYFHKQYGTYRSHPVAFEQARSVREAQAEDPTTNGKGGALLDGRLWREFPVPRSLAAAA